MSPAFPPGLKVVALGGGTGLPVVLRALKHAIQGCGGTLTGIVNVTDDGGSSGRLRRDYHVLPMGDIRNCLVALSENEPLMSALFQYRYRGKGELGGHSVGNLILTALADCRRSYLKAIETSGEVLKISGRILPATIENVVLRARLINGRVIRGQSRIAASAAPIDRVMTSPSWPGPASGVLTALREADLVILGPGSLFTSILPNLLVRGVPQAIARSRAARVLIGNLMTQPGETAQFSAVDHIAAVARSVGPGLIDYYLANGRPIRPTLRRRYAREGSEPVPWSPAGVRRLGVIPVERDLVREEPGALLVRHHEGKLARALASILRMHAAGLRPASSGSRAVAS
jgi:uncharacterized cofD-like protein